MSLEKKLNLMKQNIQCNECGYSFPIYLDSLKVICEACDTIFEYKPELEIESLFVFEHLTHPYLYYIRKDSIIGRDELNFVTIFYEIDESHKERTNIRTNYISGHHARIKVKNEKELIDREGERYIVNKLKCYIEDISRMNGIQINGNWLRRKELVELKHNDNIVLAPLCRRCVNIIFKEI